MKRTAVILRAIASVLVMLVALVMTVLEATLLVTGDFMLYENSVVVFFQLCLRVIIPALAFCLGLVTLISKNPYPIASSLCLVAACAVTIPFISNYFGLYFTLLALLFAAANFFYEYTESK